MNTPEPKSRRAQRWLIAAAVVTVTGLLALIFGPRWWAVERSSRDLAAAFAEAAADDPRWRWDELNAARPHPPLGRNGMEVLAAFKSQMPPGNWGERLLTDLDSLTGRTPPNARYHEVVSEEADQQLDACAAAVATARTLRHFPTGYHPLTIRPNYVGTPIDHVQATRNAVTVLAWAAAQDARTGHLPEAVSCAHAALNVSRSVGDEPMLISQLVRTSARSEAIRALERVLGQGTPPADALANLHAALAADADEPLLLYAMAGERAGFDVMMKNVTAGVVSAKDVLGDPPEKYRWLGEGAGWWSAQDRITAERAKLLRAQTRLVAAARLPVQEQPAAFAALRAGSADVREAALIDRAHTEPIWFWRSVALAHCAAVGVACERFRLRTGRWPQSLAELAPDLLREVPIDPFDGKPLRLRRNADGVTVYSVGVNRVDDAGDGTRQPGVDHPPDIVFRLFDADKRGLPPPPEEAPEPREVEPSEVAP